MNARVRSSRSGGVLALIPLLTAIAIVAGLLMAFVPAQETQARWSSSLAVDVPALAMDRFPLTSVTDASSTYPGFNFTNGSSRTTGYWKPQSFTISPLAGSGTTSTEATNYVRNSYGAFFLSAPANCQNTSLGQEDYYYPSGNSITSGVPDPVLTPQDRGSRYLFAPQAKSHFCVRVVSNLSEYDRLRNFAGRAYTLTIASDMISAAPATWRSTTLKSSMKLSVPFPQPRLTNCVNYSNAHGELQWAWLDDYGVPANNAIDRWEVQRFNSYYGDWETVFTAASDHDWYLFGNVDIPNGYSGAYFRLVALPYAGSTYYASTSTEIYMFRDSYGYIKCGQYYGLPYEVVMP